MSGSSMGEFDEQHILDRDREIERLRQVVIRLQKEIRQLKAELAAALSPVRREGEP